MCLVQSFLGSHSFLKPLNYAFTLTPPPLIFPLLNQCDRCLVLLAWGLMAGRCRFTSHGGGVGGGELYLGAGFAKSGSPWRRPTPTLTSTKWHKACIQLPPPLSKELEGVAVHRLSDIAVTLQSLLLLIWMIHLSYINKWQWILNSK